MADKWVLDCSVMAAAILSESEGMEASEMLEQALEGRIQILVPALFWYEIGNVLATSARSRRIAKDKAQEALLRLGELPIHTDIPEDFIVRRRIIDFAITHNLTAYDAAYLELAERFNASLKTFDQALLGLHKQYAWIH